MHIFGFQTCQSVYLIFLCWNLRRKVNSVWSVCPIMMNAHYCWQLSGRNVRNVSPEDRMEKAHHPQSIICRVNIWIYASHAPNRSQGIRRTASSRWQKIASENLIMSSRSVHGWTVELALGLAVIILFDRMRPAARKVMARFADHVAWDIADCGQGQAFIKIWPCFAESMLSLC